MRRQIETIANLRGQKKPEKVAFSDVVGCDEAKDEIKQVRYTVRYDTVRYGTVRLLSTVVVFTKTPLGYD